MAFGAQCLEKNDSWLAVAPVGAITRRTDGLRNLLASECSVWRCDFANTMNLSISALAEVSFEYEHVRNVGAVNAGSPDPGSRVCSVSVSLRTRQTA